MTVASDPRREPRRARDLFVHERWRLLWRIVFPVLLATGAWLAFRDPGQGPGIPHLDKVLHLGAFASLAVVGTLGWPATRTTRFGVALFLFGYGLWIEWVQSGLPQRQADAFDLAANTVGIALGLITWHLIAAWARRAPAGRL
ncbi:MAG: VanZ family protein [Rubrivivax sp.]|jgi:VanZ family protein